MPIKMVFTLIKITQRVVSGMVFVCVLNRMCGERVETFFLLIKEIKMYVDFVGMLLGY